MTSTSRLAAAGICAVLVVALAPVGGNARTSWDGCTARSGDVRFRAADGTRLVGHLFGRGPKAIVFAHQSPGDLCQWLWFAKREARRGYMALVFDLRNYGQSQHRQTSTRGFGLDVAAAAKLVRSRGARKVFLVGASFGGSAVIVGGADARPQVDGVVSVSGAADLVGAIDAARRLQAPVLFLAGRLDTDFASDARRLYAGTASADKAIQILERGEHGTDLVASSPAARRLIDGFFAAH
ncbi:MAG TPA: alpha/beta hydrolase [Gaiellaceae bacterium]|jgi:pimeloyl-ACP methyl ester carboxylesterase|nr:alpha/beta hydrolase [Gaiellaceae bacterium]